MGRDNGGAGAEGQPPQPAFPKAFAKGSVTCFVEVFAGLTASDESNLPGTSELAFQQGLKALVEFLEPCVALDQLAIDEEGGRRIDLQNVGGVLLIGGDLVEQRLILEAVLDRLLAQPGLLADPRQGLGGVLDHPVVLLPG